MFITSDSGRLINLNQVESYSVEVIGDERRGIERRLTLWFNGKVEEFKVKCPIVYQELIKFLEERLKRKKSFNRF